MTGKKIVFVIGFMGSGKTTVGRKLAASMGWTFIDLDHKIEEHALKTISRIFSEEGEEQFRKIESDILKDITNTDNTIVSTGGGTPCHGNNMEYMLSTGVTIYLKMTPDQLANRLLNASRGRPLLENIPDDRLPVFIEEKLSQREQWYKKADIIVDGLNLNIELLRSMVDAAVKG